jgi:hypothetical protein
MTRHRHGSFNGDLPLHTACRFGVSFEVVPFWVAQCPAAAESTSEFGSTPLHVASFWRAPFSVIPLDRDALQMAASGWATPLHAASYAETASLEVLQYMTCQWPIASLLLDDEGYSPLDLAEREDEKNLAELHLEQLPEDIIRFMTQTTKDAASALIECALNSKIDMPPAVTAHVEDTIRTVTPVITRGDTVLSESIRSHLNHPLLQTLLRNDELQPLLKEARYQTLIEGLHCMNRAGRKRRIENPEDEQMALTVLNVVTDNRDCLFLHLRENPAALCRGDAVGLPFDWKVVRHQDVARMHPG